MAKTLQRRGDGTIIEMTVDEVRKDLEEGVQDAASRANVPPLSKDEIKDFLHQKHTIQFMRSQSRSKLINRQTQG